MKLRYLKTIWCEVDIEMFTKEQQVKMTEQFKKGEHITNIIDWERTSEEELYKTEECLTQPLNGMPTRAIADWSIKKDENGNKSTWLVEIWNNGAKPHNNE